MKKLILLASLFITLQSCDNPIKEVENPKQKTTVEIIENIQKDTMQVSVVSDKVYLLKDNIVKYELVQKSKDKLLLNSTYVLIIHTTLLVLLIVVFATILDK